jgi:hypothetical protein
MNIAPAEKWQIDDFNSHSDRAQLTVLSLAIAFAMSIRDEQMII